jgi:SAM-dependent methyltransferase
VEKLPRLQTVDSWAADAELLSRSIRNLPGPLEILEAGCGREWPIKLDGLPYRLTGIDLDEAALRSRVRDVGDLHDAIVGDLAEPGTIPANRYDVVYSSFVLEHIRDAEAALANMMSGLKRGGLLLLRIPDRNCVYGWTVRRTPFSVHVGYYRFVLGIADAGRPGFAPYPAYHAPIVSRRGIRDFCERNRCEILQEVGHTYYLRGKGLVPLATGTYARAMSVLSFGSLAWRHNNLTYVIRRA